MNRTRALMAVVGAGLLVAGCRVKTPPSETSPESAPPEGVMIMTNDIVPERAAAPATGEWVMVWNDEFDAPEIDRAKWNHVVAGDGFGNNELQYYTDFPENSFIKDGCLVIQALQRAYKGQHYTSAKLFSQGKGDWTYGRFEVRAKLPFGQGLWPAIWMMPTDYTKYGAWPSCGEIDIAEMVGFKPGTVYGTLHYGNPWKNAGREFSLPAGQKFADDFHVFALEWVPGKMTWFLDGAPYSTQTDWYTSSPGAMWPAPFDRDFYIQLNVAVGGSWPGHPDTTTVFPQQMLVDYVRVYQYTGEFAPVEKRSAAPPELRPREPLPDGNLVYNGTFDDGTNYWNLATAEGAEAAMAAEGGGLNISIAKVGTPVWSVQLLQKPLNIERGKTYKVAFDARANALREIIVKVGKASQHWDNYSGDHAVIIGPEQDHYSFRFKMRRDTDPVARLDFNLGTVAQNVFIDNVTVRPGEEDLAYEVNGLVRLAADGCDGLSGVKFEACAEGGVNAGWIEAGDWLEFHIDVKRSGLYSLDFRFSNGGTDAAAAAIQSNGRTLLELLLPVSGDWQSWQTARTVVPLPAGPQRLRVECVKTGFNLNWIELDPTMRQP